MTPASGDPLAVLDEQAERYGADRHPLKHATTQFHRGGVLLARDDVEGAELAFTTSVALFRARGARPEAGKALNGLGATLRAAGRLDLAAQALAHAAAELAAAGLPLDEGAARFNLGLVLRERGDPGAAVAALTAARGLLDPARVPGQAAAAARELGAAHLDLGEAAAAEGVLAEAVALADRAGDPPARAAAANLLGLALLAAGRPSPAADAFLDAVASSPRALRPEAFAMAQANLATALEAAHDEPAARLAARQALGVPEAPDAVRAQSRGVLDRLGTPTDEDLHAVLAAPRGRGRRDVAVEELVRAAGLAADERATDMRAWVALPGREFEDPADAAELWLGVLLELPPDALEALVTSALRAAATVDPEVREDFRAAVARALPRFAIPQWMRLQDVIARAADAVGDPGPWR